MGSFSPPQGSPKRIMTTDLAHLESALTKYVRPGTFPAALWKSGGRLASSFGGRIDCSEEIIVPMRSGKCEVILPCYGDRIYAQTQDHEMAFAIPFSRILEIVEGLEGTHKGGVRYPIPSFLRYTGEFPPQYAKVAD